MNLQNVEDAERRNIAEKNVNHGHGVKVIDSGVVLVKEEMKPVREHPQLLGLNPKAERMVRRICQKSRRGRNASWWT